MNELKLPAQECYNVMQDSKGYIWISTEGGLCKYNGQTLNVFNKHNGLPENSTYTVKEGKDSAIWCTTRTNRVVKIKNDSLSEASCSKNISAAFRKHQHIFHLSFIEDSIWISSQHQTFKAVLNSKEIRKVLPDDSVSSYYFKEVAGYLVAVKRFYKDYLKQGAQFLNVTIETARGTKKLQIKLKTDNQPHWRSYVTAFGKNGYLISINDKLLRIFPDLSIKVYDFNDHILAVYADKDLGIWIGTLNEGLHYFPDLDNESEIIKSLPACSVTGICEDSEGGIWCTTLEKGVFYSKTKKITGYNYYPGLSKKCELLKNIDGTIYVSTNVNELYSLKDSIKHYKLQPANGFPFCDILKHKNNWYLISRSNFYVTDKTFQIIEELNYRQGQRYGGRQLEAGPDKRIFSLGYDVLDEIINRSIHSRLRSLPLSYCLLYNEGSLWLGADDGIYRIKMESWSVEKIEGINDHVKKMCKTSDNTIWFCTRNSGVYKIENGIIKNISVLYKLPDARYNDITKDRSGNIWLAGNTGIIHLYEKHNFEIYNTDKGLPSNEVFRIETTDKHVFFSTSEGLFRFPVSENLRNTQSPPIYIARLYVNEKSKPVTNDFHLKYNMNSLRISCERLCFKEPLGPDLYFEMQGADIKRQFIEGNELLLDNLKPGQYNLKIYAINNHKIMSAYPAVLNFIIEKPFWLQTWFIMLSVIFGLIIIFLAGMTIIKRIKRKEKEKTRINSLIAEYQLTALRAQMNPHFIFNAINSIQTYILDNESQIAYDYLSRFSKLIRIVLNNAKEKTISLEQELEVLKMYCELEQIRFENKFDFEFIVDSALDEYNIYVPPLIIQPYIENAIWHGIMPLKGVRKGRITIKVYQLTNKVHIAVTDNGIGREASSKINKTPGHKSVAMSITKERIDVIKSLTGFEEADIIISDVVENHEIKGTKVEIVIPIN